MAIFWIVFAAMTVLNFIFCGVSAREADRTERLIENFTANIDGKINRRIEAILKDGLEFEVDFKQRVECEKITIKFPNKIDIKA